jgi:hypothetical protein
VFAELGLAWQGYLSSDWGGGEDAAPCPPGGCDSEPASDGITSLGIEAGVGYRDLTAGNPAYPQVGVGVYRVGADDTTGTRFGVHAGIAIPFSRSVGGPELEIRYFRLFGEPRFKSMLLVPLRWSF